VKKEDGRHWSSYDRFRGRVIFHGHGLAGKGLPLVRECWVKKRTKPTQVHHSTETDILHKSDVL